jgi:hypothetical protein
VRTLAGLGVVRALSNIMRGEQQQRHYRRYLVQKLVALECEVMLARAVSDLLLSSTRHVTVGPYRVKRDHAARNIAAPALPLIPGSCPTHLTYTEI